MGRAFGIHLGSEPPPLIVRNESPMRILQKTPPGEPSRQLITSPANISFTKSTSPRASSTTGWGVSVRKVFRSGALILELERVQRTLQSVRSFPQLSIGGYTSFS